MDTSFSSEGRNDSPKPGDENVGTSSPHDATSSGQSTAMGEAAEEIDGCATSSGGQSMAMEEAADEMDGTLGDTGSTGDLLENLPVAAVEDSTAAWDASDCWSRHQPPLPDISQQLESLAGLADQVDLLSQ